MMRIHYRDEENSRVQESGRIRGVYSQFTSRLRIVCSEYEGASVQIRNSAFWNLKVEGRREKVSTINSSHTDLVEDHRV